jgi:hypothetical protein
VNEENFRSKVVGAGWRGVGTRFCISDFFTEKCFLFDEMILYLTICFLFILYVCGHLTIYNESGSYGFGAMSARIRVSMRVNRASWEKS